MNQELEQAVLDQQTPETERRCRPAPHSAQWTVSLDADCPKCGENVNLLDAPDFWDGRQLDIPEHGTENSDNLDVTCPECGHDFKACCQW